MQLFGAREHIGIGLSVQRKLMAMYDKFVRTRVRSALVDEISIKAIDVRPILQLKLCGLSRMRFVLIVVVIWIIHEVSVVKYLLFHTKITTTI